MNHLISYNPATGQKIWEGKSSSKDEVVQKVEAAQRAFKKWALLSFEERKAFILKFKEVLEKNQTNLAEAISKETGKPLWDSKGEVNAMINKVELSIESYEERCPPLERDLQSGHSITRYRPYGVMAVFGPYNFPGHLPNGHILPALLAGNTLLFKPSELTPYVGELIDHYWREAELPEGVFNLVQGGREVGQAIVSHPLIDGLLFTGSYATGKIMAEYYSARPEKILALEMGGNNPLIIWDVQELEAASYLTIQSAYISSGQRCTCARRLIIPNDQSGDRLLETLKQAISHIRVGAYTDSPEPFLGPVISETHANRLLASQSMLQNLGGKPLLEMKLLKIGTGFLSPGLMDVTEISHPPDEEIFGPFLQVIRVKDFSAAIEAANQTKYGLVAGLLSDKQENYNQFYAQVKAGVINWNAATTGASSAAPFGGVGCSGNLRPSGYFAIDYCVYPVASIETQKISMPTQKLPGLNNGSV